jgi:hypothetical protein
MAGPLSRLDIDVLASISNEVEHVRAPLSKGEAEHQLLAQHFGHRGQEVMAACLDTLGTMWVFRHELLEELTTA